MMMKNLKTAFSIKQLSISMILSLSFMAHSAFSAAVPEYVRLNPVDHHLNFPTEIALDRHENMYVSDSIENRVLIFSQSGSYMKTLTGLREPLGVAVDQQGRIYVGNKLDANVEVYDSNLQLLFKLGSGNGEFAQPTSIAVYGDRIYVADSLQDVIKVYNPDGSFSFSFGSTGSDAGKFNFPVSLVVNEISDELIVLDRQHIQSMSGVGQGARIQIFDMDGVFIRSFGERGIGNGKISKPVGVAVDSEGRIYVTDTFQQLVQVFDGNGTFLTSLYDEDHQLRTPVGIVWGKSNRLFIASLHTESVEVYGIDSYMQLSVDPLNLYFEGDEQGTNPESKSVEISNNGNSLLNWSASSENSWITLSEGSGPLAPLGSHTMEIGVNMTGLDSGIHTGHVLISDETGASETVEIELNVVQPPIPELSVNPISLDFESVNGSIPSSRSLSITNEGTGILSWTASSDDEWISMDKITGTAPDAVSVSVNISGLQSGLITGSITVTGEGAVSSPRIVPVTLDIREEKGDISVNSNLDNFTFIINGTEYYTGSGNNWTVTNAPAGTYYIQFNSIQGYVTPAYQSKALVAEGKITFYGEYVKAEVEEEEQADKKRYLNIITGAGPGEDNTGFIKVYDPDGIESGVAFQAHGYPYGVNVAAGDINNDGIDEIITAPGPAHENPAEISIFDHTGMQFHHLTTTVFPYYYGANIASGDINCDGYDEVIVGTGSGAGNPSELKVFVHDPEQEKLVDSGINLSAYASGGGVLVASGDVDCDQHNEIITASANTYGEKIKISIWEVDTSAGIGQWSVSLAKEFSIKKRKYSKFSLRTRDIDSISITTSDINGDGFAEIVTGSRSNSGGASIINIFDKDGGQISEFQAGDRSHYISSVASADIDGDGAAEIIAGTIHRSLQTVEVTIFDAFGSEIMTFPAQNTQNGINLAVGSVILEK